MTATIVLTREERDVVLVDVAVSLLWDPANMLDLAWPGDPQVNDFATAPDVYRARYIEARDELLRAFPLVDALVEDRDSYPVPDGDSFVAQLRERVAQLGKDAPDDENLPRLKTLLARLEPNTRPTNDR